MKLNQLSKCFFTGISILFLLLQSSMAGTILVTNVLSNSVTLFDEASLSPIKEIPVGFMPHEVEVSPNGQLAVVSNFGDLLNVIPGHSISVIDIANAKVIQTIVLPKNSRPHGMQFISDSQLVVTAQGIQSLLLVDMNGKISQTLPLPGAGAHLVKVDANKQFAYVANTDSGTITKINLQNFSVVGDVKVGQQAEGLTLIAQDNLLLVTNRTGNSLTALQTTDLSILKNIQTDFGPTRVEKFNNGLAAIVINTISGTIQVINNASLTIEQNFKTTDSINPLPVPINAFIRPDQHTAFVTNSFAGNIVLIDLLNGQILNTFKAGLMPDGIAVSPINAVDSGIIQDAEFSSGALEINANIDLVWKIAKNVNDYDRISHGAVSAALDDPIMPGKTIKLRLYKDKIIGKFIPESDEIVSVVDEDKKILAWVKQLPDGTYTERYQLLEKLADNKTRSIIVLRIPGLIGVITKATFGTLIEDAFRDLNFGFKVEAEPKFSS